MSAYQQNKIKRSNIMIIGINYSDTNFKNAQKLNTWSLYHNGKVDKVIEYSPKDLDADFIERNKEILSMQIGGGYWLWKPYIIRKAYNLLNEGDYLFYCDSGTVILKPIQTLIESMEKASTNVMPFQLTFPERMYSKRDAFVLMECDSSEFSDSKQRLAGYMILKKATPCSNKPNFFADLDLLLTQWLHFSMDARIITDQPNAMNLPNYKDFIENRHDQTVWSLLTKKYGIPAFRDPSQYGENTEKFDEDVVKRSLYPIVIDLHRNMYLKTWREYKRFIQRGRIPPKANYINRAFIFSKNKLHLFYRHLRDKYMHEKQDN